MAGLYTGALAVKTYAADEKAGQTAPKDDKKTDKHECKGKNTCAGKGGCGSSDMGCKGKNSCKGKGGCSTMDKKADDTKKTT
jgi:hypothetical protein